MQPDQFMAGFSLADSAAFDDWQRLRQQQLSQALRDALERLIRYFIQTGECKQAIEYARRRVRLDTLDEAAHRQLMQLYAWSGQQGLALRQYEQCADILAEELGIPPSAETMRLRQELQAAHATLHENQEPSATRHDQQVAQETVRQPVTTPRHNLPRRLPKLIGRNHDLRALQAILQCPDANLLTLIGPGGVGKTQLALQFASLLLVDFADGIFFVSLAALGEAEEVVSAIAQTWNLHPQSHQSLMESVQSYLHTKRMLLILDNFEHVMAAAPMISELLGACAYLRIVVTSREVLNVHGEHLYAVAPLALPKQGGPSAPSTVAESAAVQLFVQRAQAAAPDFALVETSAIDIAEICTYLDGLPLAIELVAARVRLLTPRSLRQRLVGNSSPFELLNGGARDAPLRHRTVRDTIAWSYALLTAPEQRLFRLLTVFVGSCTLDAVEAVCEKAKVAQRDSVLDMLASLVNKSLIQQVVLADDESRFVLLESIRDYGLEQLRTNGEYTVVACAHAETYAAFAEDAIAALAGPDDLVWRERLNAEQGNNRAALDWAITNHHPALALRIGGTLWSFWLERGQYREGHQLLAKILKLDGAERRTPAHARVLTGLGAISRAQGNMREAHNYLEEAVAICREWGDERSLAVALERLVEGCSLDFSLPKLYQLCTEAVSLYEKVGEPVGATRLRQWFGFDIYHKGDYRAAQAICEESLVIYKAQRYEAGIGGLLFDLGRALFQAQEYIEANQRFAEALQRAQARGKHRLVADALYFMGRVAYHQAEELQAQPLFAESLRIAREIGTRASSIAFPLAFLSEIALARGEVASARTMLREALTLSYVENHPYAVSLILPRCASLMVTLGKHTIAVQLAAAGHALYHSLYITLPPNDQIAFDIPLTVVRSHLPAVDFARAWAAGEQMTMDTAVALALAEITDPPSTNGTPQPSAAHRFLARSE